MQWNGVLVEEPVLPGMPEQQPIRRATPMESLLMKMDAWLLQQPEFILLLDAPRETRRKAARALAQHILTYPMRGMPFGGGL